jgi:putative tryptophan/tyrosine transport system substrate-binding protein
MRRIGVLFGPFAAGDPEAQARLSAFLQGLAQFGWTEGRNARIDARWPAGNADNLRKFAAELTALAPDVIVASSRPGLSGDTTSDPRRTDRFR